MEPVEMPSLPPGYTYNYDEYDTAHPRGSSQDPSSRRDSYRIVSPTRIASSISGVALSPIAGELLQFLSTMEADVRG